MTATEPVPGEGRETNDGRELAPVAATDRLLGLDVLRGVAILGIFVVNVAFFAGPMQLAAVAPPPGSPTSESLAWGLVKAGFELKFISIFSLLFGAGLVLQAGRAEARGRPFAGMYSRRLLVLAVVGILHGIFLFYGDILFTYAGIGFVLLLCRKWSPWTLASVGTVLALLVGTGIFVFADAIAESDTEEPHTLAELVEYSGPPPSGTEIAEGLEKDGGRWFSEVELAAYRNGPQSFTVAVRTVSFMVALIVMLLTLGWRVLGTFFIGAALMKWGLFGPDAVAAQRRLAVIALPVGLLLEITLAVTIHGQAEQSALTYRLEAIHTVSSLVLALGLVGAVLLWVHRARPSGLHTSLSAVGRMALTNYLLQSVVATFVFTSWGASAFGRWSRVEQLALVAAVFVAQCVLSRLWLSRFSMGPAERLWRTLTYGRAAARG